MNTNNGVWKLLDDLSQKKGITEVIINNIDNIYVERQGELIRLNQTLKVQDIKDFIIDVARFNKTVFNSENPILDGVLPDTSRVNVISSEYTMSAPAITIRKYLREIKTFDHNPSVFGLNEKSIKFFKTLVDAKMNVLVSGGTGNGKTTLLNLLLQQVSPTERVITIEDTKELSFDLPNTVALIAKKSIANKDKYLTTSQLLKNTLRMRPDRIIIGEVRGEEAFDFLQAMNTGHEGSMCTIHSSSTVECLSRLENLFLLKGHDVPLKAVRQQIAMAIDFIVQLGKDKNGNRQIIQVTEITGMEADKILRQDILSMTDDSLKFTGIVPNVIKRLMNYGLNADFFV